MEFTPNLFPEEDKKVNFTPNLFPDVEPIQNFTPNLFDDVEPIQQPISEPRGAVGGWGEDDEDSIGFGEEFTRNPPAIPFDPRPAFKVYQLYKSSKRLQANEYVDENKREADRDRVSEYLKDMVEEQSRGKTIPAKVYDVLSQMPAFVGEFLLTGGLASLGKKAATKGLTKLLGTVVKKQAGKLAVKGIGWGISGGLRAAQMPHRVAESVLGRRIPEGMKLTEEGKFITEGVKESPFTSAWKGFGDVWIEMMSEEAGAGLSKGLSIISKKVPFIGKAVRKLGGKWIGLGGGRNMSQFYNKIGTATGYHGVLEEMGEERLGDFMRAVVGIQDFGAGEGADIFDRVIASIPKPEQMLIEGIAFSIPGVARAGAGMLMQKTTPKAPIEPTAITPAVEPTPQVAPVKAPIVKPSPQVKPTGIAKGVKSGEIISTGVKRITAESTKEEWDTFKDRLEVENNKLQIGDEIWENGRLQGVVAEIANKGQTTKLGRDRGFIVLDSAITHGEIISGKLKTIEILHGDDVQVVRRAKPTPKPTPQVKPTGIAKGVVSSESIIPEKGKSFKFSYIRNLEKSPDRGARFGQNVEPAGRYMTVGKAKNVKDLPNFETGEKQFDNPLIVDFGGGYGEKSNWKNVVSKQFGGKVGTELTKAIKKAGYDGIVTISKSGGKKYTSEILDLDIKKPTPTISQEAIKAKAEGKSVEEFVKGQDKDISKKLWDEVEKKHQVKNINWSKADKEEFDYCTSCVESTAEKIDDLVDYAKEISYNKFINIVGKEKIKELFPIYAWEGKGLKLKDDYSVSYGRGVFENKPAYYIQHSAIEYIFKGKSDVPKSKLLDEYIDYDDFVKENIKTKAKLTDIYNKAGVEKVELPVKKKPEPKFEVHAGVDIGIDKFVAEEVKPLARKVVETGRALGKSAKIIPKTLINIFEPSKAVERHLGKETYARVIRGIHKPEAKEIEFSSKQLEAVDSNINELGKWFGKYSSKDLENVMISRGHGLQGDARRLQIKAFASLPKELKAPQIRRAIDEIADFNYKFLQKVAGDDIHYVEDYFYGVYKNPKAVTRFLDYWRSTEKFTKQKIIPTVAHAKAYGLELKDKNPVENLKREYLAIAKLEAMNWMKGELLRTGEGIYIAPKETAPTNWEKVNDPVFKDLRLEPELAKLINNLISANKISQVPGLNALRLVNNVLRSIKFIGSAFHLGVVSKQSVADSGYLGFAYKKTALKGATTGFRTNDPIFRTPEYKDYLEHGGGHRFSIESDAQTMLSRGFDKIIKGNQLGGWLRIGGTAARLPSEFVKWMFSKYIPKLKYSKYLDFVAEKEKSLGRRLLSSEKIDIIKEQQNFYGMMNERLFGRSGTVTTALRFFFMAPGFAEGNYRTMAKAGIQWGRKGTFGAGRSRFNIVNSLIISSILATVGTLIFTGKSPKKPETLDDVRDLFKIDTGKVDTKGRKIMIDLLTYDKDYFNIYFNLARGRPDKAIGESIKRIGGMKATTFGTITDLSMIMQGRALYDWKGDRIVEITDPFLKKVTKIAQYEIEKIQPISFSVFKQSRRKGVDTFMSAIEALVGIRPALTEADKREQKILQKMYSLYGQKDNLYRYLGTLNKPAERVDKYNETVNTILNNKLVSKELRNEWEKKLIIDKDRLLAGKVYRLRKIRITDAEAEKIEKYIRNWGIKKEDEMEFIRMYKRLKGRRKLEATKIMRRKHL